MKEKVFLQSKAGAVRGVCHGCEQPPVRVRMPDGGMVVAWQAFSRSSGGYYLYAQRLDPRGATLGRPMKVNAEPMAHECLAVIASRPDGSFVVNWRERGDLGGQRYVRRVEPVALARPAQRATSVRELAQLL